MHVKTIHLNPHLKHHHFNMKRLRRKFKDILTRLISYTQNLKSQTLTEAEIAAEEEKKRRAEFIRQKAMISKSREQWPGGPLG